MHRSLFIVAAVAVAAGACAPAVSPAPAPITAHSHPGAALAEPIRIPPGASYSAADVRFARHMIPHHDQALMMTALVEQRTDSRDIRMIAERIEVSQRDEIARMQRWLEARGQHAPGVMDHASHHASPHAAGGMDHASHDHQHGTQADMPGMLSPEQMARLHAVSSAEFDRLFLEYMIEHHVGALTMVQDLFADGGGQEPEMFQLASDIDADQRMEIERMRQLLANR